MAEILSLDAIHTYYGKSYILQGLSISVPTGAIVGLMGRNGMGKTTTMRSIIGFTPCRDGRIVFRGEDIARLKPYEIARKGVSIVPQGRRIFPSLTVKENLEIACRGDRKQKDRKIEKALSFFPRLTERLGNKGNQLSGGEQQMLAISRAVICAPKLMLMDEPSEGLSPLMVEGVGRILLRLKEEGLAILLAEQNLQLVLNVADHIYVINKGAIVFGGTPDELRRNGAIEKEYLAV